MSFLGYLRAALATACCAAALVLAGPAHAAEIPPCGPDDFPPAGSSRCIDSNGDEIRVGSLSDDDPMSASGGLPGGFVALFVLAALVGVAVVIWKVSTARQLATDAGMDPDVATGMTLLDDDGLTATYLASSLRTARPADQAPPGPPSATQRLTELKALLDGGLISQAEYDQRRAAIIDSV